PRTRSSGRSSPCRSRPRRPRPEALRTPERGPVGLTCGPSPCPGIGEGLALHRNPWRDLAPAPARRAIGEIPEHFGARRRQAGLLYRGCLTDGVLTNDSRRLGMRLELLTVGWNAVEAVIAIA